MRPNYDHYRESRISDAARAEALRLAGQGELAQADGSAFEVAPTDLQFRCSHAVYAKGGNSSFCYVTSAERGEFIVTALDAWRASGGMQAWLDLRLNNQAEQRP